MNVISQNTQPVSKWISGLLFFCLFAFIALLISFAANNLLEKPRMFLTMGQILENNAYEVHYEFNVRLVRGLKPDEVNFFPLVNGKNEGFQFPIVNPDFFENTTFPNGTFIYKRHMAINGVGSDVPDITIIASGVKKEVCEAYNQFLYESVSIPSSGLPLSALVAYATVTNPSSDVIVDMNSVKALNQRMSGCFSTTDGSNVFFHVIYSR